MTHARSGTRRLLPLAALAFTFGAFCATAADKPQGQSQTIGALGTIQSESGLIVLAGPPGATIAEIPVARNAEVRPGQILARFDNHEALRIELEGAQLEHEELIADHAIDLRRHELELEKTKQGLTRAQSSLAHYLAISESARVGSILEERHGQVNDSDIALKLKQVEGQRLTTHFEQEDKKLRNRIEGIRLKLKASELTAPIAGTVLEIRRRVGEAAGGDIFVLADLQALRVETEVFEGDIGRIKLGQKAEITAKPLGSVGGQVEAVGRQIDPDRKVAKVWIRLDQSEAAAHYLGMEVNVSIRPE